MGNNLSTEIHNISPKKRKINNNNENQLNIQTNNDVYDADMNQMIDLFDCDNKNDNDTNILSPPSTDSFVRYFIFICVVSNL